MRQPFDPSSTLLDDPVKSPLFQQRKRTTRPAALCVCAFALSSAALVYCTLYTILAFWPGGLPLAFELVWIRTALLYSSIGLIVVSAACGGLCTRTVRRFEWRTRCIGRLVVVAPCILLPACALVLLCIDSPARAAVWFLISFRATPLPADHCSLARSNVQRGHGAPTWWRRFGDTPSAAASSLVANMTTEVCSRFHANSVLCDVTYGC